ncbi:MAG: hypothetical protein AB8B73_13610 [Ekhidna sp.]
MDFKNHDNNLRIIGKIFLVIGLVLVPISIFSFFFAEIFSESDLWLEIDDFDILFLQIRNPERLLYLFPLIHFISSTVFLVSGFGLASQKDWGKKLAIVPAVLLLFKFPIGTALGVYMIYALHYEPKTEEVLADQ